MEDPLEPTMTQRPFNHLMPLTLIERGIPRPTQLIPSSEIATEFPPCPTATNFGLLKVVKAVEPTPKPLVVKTEVAPLPVQAMPSTLVAIEFPP